MQNKYSRSDLVQYIAEQLHDGADEQTVVKQAAAYLIEYNKTSDLPSVIRDVQELRARKYGTVEVTALSAFELGAAQLEEITAVVRSQYPDAKQVQVNTEHDESVVGGVVVSLPQATLDISIRNKLNRLRESIS